MKRYSVVIILAFWIMSIVFELQAITLEDLGNKESGYTVTFEEGTALLSRDGSEPVAIKNGASITNPGTYFLTQITNNESTYYMFTIRSNKIQTGYTIKSEKELEEIIKRMLEQYQTTISIQFDFGNYTINDMTDLIQSYADQLTRKYPMLIYKQFTVTMAGSKRPKISLEITYPSDSKQQLENYNERTMAKMKTLLQTSITNDMEDYEKEYALTKALISQVIYTDKSPFCHSMLGALAEGKAVCDGYARSLMYLLNAVGVSTKFISGTATSEGVTEAHAWNLVKIQGEYYHVDSTWADQDSKKIGKLLDYYNEQDSYMLKTHKWKQSDYPKAITSTYCLPFMSLDESYIYKINKQKELETALKEIQKAQYHSGDLILHNVSSNRWATEKILEQLANILGSRIYYESMNKYDTLIISYSVESDAK